MTPTDFRAITPLVWEHINPYGRYELDMESRLAIKAESSSIPAATVIRATYPSCARARASLTSNG